jgi:hypothetical protein
VRERLDDMPEQCARFGRLVARGREAFDEGKASPRDFRSAADAIERFSPRRGDALVVRQHRAWLNCWA